MKCVKEKPMISIIVPVYNDETYLAQCFDSILNQTFTNFEIIAINDGSVDESGTICKAYAKMDNRIKVVHQKKKGVSAARNLGIASATGDYIGFVDGDDYVEMDMYEKMYQACKKTGSNISICKLGREIDGRLRNELNEYYTREMSNMEAMKELFKGNLYRFSLCNKLFDKKCFTGITFPEGRIHEDLSTTYRLFANAEKVVYLNYIGYIYVKRKDSILTKSYYEKRLDAFIGWEEIIAFMDQKYPKLSNIVNCSYTYNCVDQMFYILNQVEDRKNRRQYLRVIQASIRNNYKNTRKNTILSYHYKFIVTLMNYHISLFLITYQVRKMKESILN
jgi:glycosyltransferase involved in cell wall biosynthesis